MTDLSVPAAPSTNHSDGGRSSLRSFIDNLMRAPIPEPEPAVSTGFSELDGILRGGLRPHQLTLIGGESGFGSSTLGLNIAAHAAIDQQLPAVYLAPATEMPIVHARIVASQCKVPVTHVRNADLNDDYRSRIGVHQDRLTKAPLTLATNINSAASPLEVANYLETIADDGTQLAVVDIGAFSDPRRGDFIRALKLVALRHNLSVVVLAPTAPMRHWQGPEGQVDELHRFTDVLDLLDLVILIDRDEAHDALSVRPGEADLHVVKNRYGPCRLLTVAFQGHYGRFVEFAIDT